MTTRRDGVARRLWILVFACLAFIPAWPSAAQSPGTAVLDRFDDLALWHAAGSDGVRASIHAGRGLSGLALRLDFDLAGTAGYALAARPLSLDLPDNYELAFDLRGNALVNDFQVKLVDDTGENVWWYRRQNLEFPRQWQHVAIKARQVEFAWGPTKQRKPRHIARIEFVVAAGTGGGGGSIFISGLTLRERPPQPTSWSVPAATASSALAGAEPARAGDLQQSTAWRSDPASGPEQWLTLDFGQPREFGGLVLRWHPGLRASRYDVQVSDDARDWRTVRNVDAGRVDMDALLLPESDARYVRLLLHDGPARAYALDEVEIRDLAFGASPNAFFESVAREYPRGGFPRAFSGQQSYWTIVGVDGGSDTGLLSEDGTLEVAKGGFSVEPFVRTPAGLVTWADAKARQSLAQGYLPIPSVTWNDPRWSLRVTALATGTRAQSRLVARYDVRNLGNRPLSLELDLAIRPSQVNPPAQFLNAPGGVAPIRDIAWNGTSLTINTEREVLPLTRPGAVAAFPFDSGPIVGLLSERSDSTPTDVHDAFGYASAVLRYPITLAPGASRTIALALPLSGTGPTPTVDERRVKAWLDQEQRTLEA
jgi:hypothetical protein